jgi:hypothetical protein
MIEAYFEEVEGVLQDFPNIRSYTLTKRIYNLQQGYIGGTITFGTGCRLEFAEVKDAEVAGKLKYRYQFMDEVHESVFRYDNAPHHPEIQTFPHHKHTIHSIMEGREPTLRDVLLEIAQLERRSVA